MDSTQLITPAYSTSSFVLLGILVSAIFIAGIISLLYWINTRMRRGMKETQDDWKIERDIEAGHTLHAEGIYGGRHPEEGGRHLHQEDPHPKLAGLKTSLKDGPTPDQKTFDDQVNRNVY